MEKRQDDFELCSTPKVYRMRFANKIFFFSFAMLAFFYNGMKTFTPPRESAANKKKRHVINLDQYPLYFARTLGKFVAL